MRQILWYVDVWGRDILLSGCMKHMHSGLWMYRAELDVCIRHRYACNEQAHSGV